MAITIFNESYSPRANEEFREWMTSHPDGYYLNERGPADYMIHRATCPHLFHETQVRLARNAKVAAPTTGELRKFAAGENASVETCSACGEIQRTQRSGC